MFATPALAGPNWPDVPDPPRSKSEWVARDAVVNGLPSRVEHFDSDLTSNEVLNFYRKRWAGAKVGPPRETNSGGWQGLSTLVDDFQIAVQVRPRSPSGSEGLISTAHFGGVRKDPFPSQLPRFSDMHITQVTESLDGNQRSQLVSMVSNESFDLNVSRWRGEWLRRGWQVAFDKEAPVDRDGIKTWLASFSKPPQSVDLAMTWRPSDRRTYLTANLISPVTGGRP